MKTSAKSANRQARRRASRRASAFIWIGAAALLILIVYGVTRNAGVAYGEADLQGVSFAALDPDRKQRVLEEANRARCTCGCGMTLAQCVATDMTCPIRSDNLTRIRGMVDQARQ
jgi:hypothetical protein